MDIESCIDNYRATCMQARLKLVHIETAARPRGAVCRVHATESDGRMHPETAPETLVPPTEG